MTWNGTRHKSPRLVQVEAALGGREAGEYIAVRRARGMTYAAIAREMSVAAGIDIKPSPFWGWEHRWRVHGGSIDEPSGAT